MNFREYQQEVTRTMMTSLDHKSESAYYSLGISGEAGEVVEQVKKFAFHGHAIDENKLGEEIGDVLWYLAALAKKFNLKLEDIAEYNIEKLKMRYPNGFEKDKSINRIENKK